MPSNSHFGVTLRTLSLLLSFALAIEPLAYAAPIPARGVFEKTQKTHVELPVSASVATLEDAWFAPPTSERVAAVGVHDERAESARNGQPPTGPDHRLVYLLQDAHTNASAQFNMATLLEALMNQDKDLTTVFVEAGFGNDTLSSFKPLTPLADRTRNAAAFVRQGYLGGEEYLSLISQKDFTIWGVEDRILYDQAVNDYRKTRDSRNKFSQYLDSIDLTLQTLESRVLNPLLQVFNSKAKAYTQNKLSLTDYLDTLETEALRLGLSKVKGTELAKLSAIRSLEKSLDFKKAQEEQVRAIASLPKVDQDELQNHTPSKLQAKEEGENAFYPRLEEK